MVTVSLWERQWLAPKIVERQIKTSIIHDWSHHLQSHWIWFTVLYFFNGPWLKSDIPFNYSPEATKDTSCFQFGADCTQSTNGRNVSGLFKRKNIVQILTKFNFELSLTIDDQPVVMQIDVESYYTQILSKPVGTTIEIEKSITTSS